MQTSCVSFRSAADLQTIKVVFAAFVFAIFDDVGGFNSMFHIFASNALVAVQLYNVL